MNFRLETDCEDYHVLVNAVRQIKHIPGMVCEIGTRRGGSMKLIIDTLLENQDYNRNVIGIDPYGNLEYVSSEGQSIRYDYTNDMRNETMMALYHYVLGKPVNLVMHHLEDQEFFNRYSDYVPFYNNVKTHEKEYSLVFFDGPHGLQAIWNEMMFFYTRSPIGAMWVVDDIHVIPYDQLKESLINNGFELFEETRVKASFKRTK
jgi:hypothetical protein